jgi:hypothetical protein
MLWIKLRGRQFRGKIIQQLQRGKIKQKKNFSANSRLKIFKLSAVGKADLQASPGISLLCRAVDQKTTKGEQFSELINY